MINKAVIDPDHSRTLFVLFPCSVKDQEEVQKLHPGIEAVKFRNRGHRWCHIRFKTVELAKQALKELNKTKVKNGKLIVAETKTRKKNLLEEKSKKPGFYKLLISNIPEGTKVGDIRSAFKTCKKIHMKLSKRNKIRKAIISMRSFADAQDILANKESHKINGVPVIIQFTKNVLNFTQNIKQMSVQQKNTNVIGRKHLERVQFDNLDSRNQYKHVMQIYREIQSRQLEYQQTDDDTSSEKADNEAENNSHVMQNYKAISKQRNEDSEQDVENESS